MDEKKPVIIKRYSNRRLYDVSHSRYATLTDIADLIKGGEEIRVVDSRTDEDLTKQIMTQIILEKEKEGENLLPVSFLYQVIRHSERSLMAFFDAYLTRSLDAYVSAQQEMEQRLKEWSPREFPTGWGFSDNAGALKNEIHALKEKIQDLEKGLKKDEGKPEKPHTV